MRNGTPSAAPSSYGRAGRQQHGLPRRHHRVLGGGAPRPLVRRLPRSRPARAAAPGRRRCRPRRPPRRRRGAAPASPKRRAGPSPPAPSSRSGSRPDTADPDQHLARPGLRHRPVLDLDDLRSAGPAVHASPSRAHPRTAPGGRPGSGRDRRQVTSRSSGGRCRRRSPGGRSTSPGRCRSRGRGAGRPGLRSPRPRR